MFQLPKGAKDLTGLKFNRLTAIAPVGVRTGTRSNGKKYSSGVYWECVCECGKKSKVLAAALIGGGTRSCGCLAKESAREIAKKYRKPPMDMTGQRYGFLTVVSPADEIEHKAHGRYWWCQCDCGSPLKAVFDGHLRSGKIVSCGCKTSELMSKALKAKPHDVMYDAEGPYFVSKEHIIRFDEEDMDIVTACLWNVDSLGYCSGLYQGEQIRLHRAIMRKYGQIDGLEVDHKSGVLDDYRKSNLRIATHAENMKNTTLERKNGREHKGVSRTRHGTWSSMITCGGEVIRIGTFKSFEDACNARDQAELDLFGEFSRLTTNQEE